MKSHTIHATLFLTYSLILIIVFSAFYVYFIANELGRIEQQGIITLSQSSDNISTAIENEVEKLNLISLNVSFSRTIKNNFTNFDENVNNPNLLKEMLTAVIGPNRPVDQINIYNMNDFVFASGVNNGVEKMKASEQPWYLDVMSTKRFTVKLTGEDPYISKYFSDEYAKSFISLFRSYFDVYQMPQGIVETKKNVRQICLSAINYKSTYGEEIFVYDSFGNIIFPSDAPQKYYSNVALIPKESIIVEQIPDSWQKKYSIVNKSKLSGFTTIMKVNSMQLLSQNLVFIQNTALITALMLLLAVGLSYLASKRFTKPIDKILSEVEYFGIGKDMRVVDIKTNITELNSLYEGFCKMQRDLVASVNKQMLLKNQDMQSRMLALQSQMNPHFLYNSISTIQAMADENMNKEIVVMCQSMSNLLRYISSDKKPIVCYEEELTHTKDYLSCMMIRFHGDLSYTTEVQGDVKDIFVPKLCMQLIVENAIKFMTTQRPPWIINIKAVKTEDYYEISVTDNGPGFEKGKLTSIYNQIEKADKTGLLPTLEINGMGLMNIYLRFKLSFENKVIFRLENLKEGGGCVTVGVKYDK